mmetsp:Transcript_28832/g.73530  ORF Transcript_28832/g.73530 Transcript_28832/m.73530 type:complete len:211 (-) Transcript_28832:52-684(-)
MIYTALRYTFTISRNTLVSSNHSARPQKTGTMACACLQRQGQRLLAGQLHPQRHHRHRHLVGDAMWHTALVEPRLDALGHQGEQRHLEPHHHQRLEHHAVKKVLGANQAAAHLQVLAEVQLARLVLVVLGEHRGHFLGVGHAHVAGQLGVQDIVQLEDSQVQLLEIELLVLVNVHSVKALAAHLLKGRAFREAETKARKVLANAHFVGRL